jgi:hypothetical protein
MSIVQYESAPNSSNVEIIEDGFDKWVKVYNNDGAAITNGAVRALTTLVDYTSVSTTYPIFKYTLATAAQETSEATESQQFGVVDNSPLGLGTIPAASYGFLKVRGAVDALVTGPVVYGDQLEILTQATSMTVAATASSGASGKIENETIGITLKTYATASAALTRVLMLGKQTAIIAT